MIKTLLYLFLLVFHLIGSFFICIFLLLFTLIRKTFTFLINIFKTINKNIKNAKTKCISIASKILH